ncbi:MAG: hypothetical protein J0H20_19355, partial [Rhizobiales bacterium]|nr:hypothetical protein [Hyphomicrobiales bacterium]
PLAYQKDMQEDKEQAFDAFANLPSSAQASLAKFANDGAARSDKMRRRPTSPQEKPPWPLPPEFYF